MLNWFLLYSLVLSFLYRIHYQHRLVAPGQRASVMGWVAMTYFRGVAITAILLLGRSDGILGKGYAAWWSTYSTEHSMIMWFATVVPLTIILYIVKECTYYVMKDPGHYEWFGKGQDPSLHIRDMSTTLIWNVIFWVWVVFCPWLPFLSCFLRVFLLNRPA